MEHLAELEDLKQTLSQNETTISEVNCQLSEARGQLKERGDLIQQINQEKAVLLKRVSGQAESPGQDGAEEGVSTSPLSSVGKRCLGEQHDKVISSQQHTIIELRKRVNDLMSNKPPGSILYLPLAFCCHSSYM